jgi:hypothetical protein
MTASVSQTRCQQRTREVKVNVKASSPYNLKENIRTNKRR